MKLNWINLNYLVLKVYNYFTFIKFSQLLLVVGLIASIQTTSALVCYSCKSSEQANCGANPISDTTGLLTCNAAPGASCVTFVNKYDNNAVWRQCSNFVWTPDAMINQTNTCVLDSYSDELFCNCNTGDLCNNYVGSKTVYRKCFWKLKYKIG